MSLGGKILEFRKKLNITQEQLAEQLSVTRQTISKWELNETTPDIKQAKELSKIFKISLDELTENEVKDMLATRVRNTEKLAGMLMKFLKIAGVIILILLIIDITTFITSLPSRVSTITSNNPKVDGCILFFILSFICNCVKSRLSIPTTCPSFLTPT